MQPEGGEGGSLSLSPPSPSLPFSLRPRTSAGIAGGPAQWAERWGTPGGPAQSGQCVLGELVWGLGRWMFPSSCGTVTPLSCWSSQPGAEFQGQWLERMCLGPRVELSLPGTALHFQQSPGEHAAGLHLYKQFLVSTYIVVVQSLSHVQLFATISWSVSKFMSIELAMPSNLILYHPLLLLPSVLPSMRVFSNESALCIRWANYWSFSFSISPSNTSSGLISLRFDWFNLLVVQGSLLITEAKNLFCLLPLTSSLHIACIFHRDEIYWGKISF